MHDYIYPGAFCRCRNGAKARIYELYDEVCHGAVYTVYGSWTMQCWYLNGFTLKRQGKYIEHSFDLIGPWIDKPVVNWPAMPVWAKAAAMNRKKQWFYFYERPTLRLDTTDPSGKDGFWWTSNFYGEIPPEYAPTWEGDWKDSLVERP